jgi:hypothetical protein
VLSAPLTSGQAWIIHDAGENDPGLADCFLQALLWCKFSESDLCFDAIADMVSKASYVIDSRSDEVLRELIFGQFGCSKIAEMVETGVPINSELSLLTDYGEVYIRRAFEAMDEVNLTTLIRFNGMISP